MTLDLKEMYESLLADERLAFICRNVDSGFVIKDWEVGMHGVHIYPGSFNPIHETHRFIYETNKRFHSQFFYETSITRVDKPPVSFEELQIKLMQFNSEELVVVTNAPRMIQKIATLGCDVGGLIIHVGTDTIRRMATDYGQYGIAGLASGFAVTDREIDDKVDSWPFKDWKVQPYNVFRSKVQPPKELLGMSSSKIRKQWEQQQKDAAAYAAELASNYVKELKKEDAEFWNSIPPDIHYSITK